MLRNAIYSSSSLKLLNKNLNRNYSEGISIRGKSTNTAWLTLVRQEL